MLIVWIRLGQQSVGFDLDLCLQRLTENNKILHWQAKSIIRNSLKEKWLEKVDF